MIQVSELIETREYELPYTDDEDQWIIECRMFYLKNVKLFKPRVYKLVEYKLLPSDEKYTESFDELVLTEDFFLWDKDVTINVSSCEEAFFVFETAMLKKLGLK